MNHQLQAKGGIRGTKPTPLNICRHSDGVGKSSSVSPVLQPRKPLIIHIRSPEVIHTQPQDFLALVQRLTGSSHSRSRYEGNDMKREAAVEVLHHSAWSSDRSQSTMSSSFDEPVNPISALVRDDDQMEISGITVNVSPKLEEGLFGDELANMDSLYAEKDRHPILQSFSNPPLSAHNMLLKMPCDVDSGVADSPETLMTEDYLYGAYTYCSHFFESFIESNSPAPQFQVSANIFDHNVFSPFQWTSVQDNLISNTSIPSATNADLLRTLPAGY